MKTIFYSKPWLTDADQAVMMDVMHSAMLAQGKRTEEFERRVSEWLGVVNGRGVAVGCGSAAIVVALQALEVGVGGEVVLPTYVCSKVLESDMGHDQSFRFPLDT